MEQNEVASGAATQKTAPMVTLRHPHTGDVQVVEGVHNKLVPLMGAGYVQVPEAPAKGE